MSSTKTHSATLLAQKILLSPQQGEIDALLDLNLPVNWFHPTSSGKLLSDLGFLHIRDSLLFDRFWKQLSAAHQVNAWDRPSNSPDALPFIGQLLVDCRYDTLSTWATQSPGTSDQWKNLASHPTLLGFSLSSAWPTFETRASALNIPHDFVAQLATYRTNNLWLFSKNEQELQATAPKAWTADQAMAWWKSSSASFSGSRKSWSTQAWRIKGLASHDEGWESWTPQQWSGFWNSVPSGFFGYEAPTAISALDVPLVRRLVDHADFSAPLLWPVLSREVVELLSISDALPSQGFTKNKASPERALGSWGKWLHPRIQQFLAADPSNGWSAGLWSVALDVELERRTMFSNRALGVWSAAPELPADFTQMLGRITQGMDAKLPAAHQLTWLQPVRLAALVAHLIQAKSLQGGSAMKDFCASLDFTLNPAAPSTVWNTLKAAPSAKILNENQLAFALTPWAVRGVSENSDPQVRQIWAELFWRTIFLADRPNQHHWLKKAAANPDLQVALSFWDKNFEAKIDEAMDSRKRTKDIHALMVKMSLLNQAAQTVDLTQKVTRSGRKM